jgi:hypothetical protein
MHSLFVRWNTGISTCVYFRQTQHENVAGYYKERAENVVGKDY